MTGGGVNWGGVAFDPVNQVVYANTSRAVHIVTLIPRPQGDYKAPVGLDFGPQRGAPFAMTRAVALSPLGLPCNRPPWGALVAVDLKGGGILWQSTVGTTEDRAPLGARAPVRNATRQRRAGDGRRCRPHRRHGCLPARLRRQDRRRALARPAAGAGGGKPHDLPMEGRAVRGRHQRAATRRQERRSATASWPSASRAPARHPRCGRAPSTWQPATLTPR